jgi:hypothetical protein
MTLPIDSPACAMVDLQTVINRCVNCCIRYACCCMLTKSPAACSTDGNTDRDTELTGAPPYSLELPALDVPQALKLQHYVLIDVDTIQKWLSSIKRMHLLLLCSLPQSSIPNRTIAQLSICTAADINDCIYAKASGTAPTHCTNLLLCSFSPSSISI